MSRVSGTSNPTNLRKLARKHIDLHRFELDGQRMFQPVRLNFDSYDFDGDELVTIIARAGNTSRRYEIGTVHTWSPEAKSLAGLDTSQVIRFRLLIRKVGVARLIATAENLRCTGDDDIESLLPIVSTDLGQRLWRIVIGEDGAELQCNETVFPTGASAESYAPFRALVLPEALRQILEYLAMDPNKISEEGSIWVEWGAWMRQMGIEVPPPQDEDQRRDWVVEATGRFCDYFKTADDLQKFLEQGDVT